MYQYVNNGLVILVCYIVHMIYEGAATHYYVVIPIV